MPVADLLSHHRDAWRAATHHPFLDAVDVGTAPTALRTTERTHLDAWWAARPGAPEYREFVDHWTLPGFVGHVAGHVAGSEAAGDGVPAPDPDTVFAEVASWGMALDSARWGMALDSARWGMALDTARWGMAVEAA